MSNQPLAPPTGLTPKWIRTEQRIVEIAEAIKRFVEASQVPPHEWLQELNELCEEMSDRLDRRG